MTDEAHTPRDMTKYLGDGGMPLLGQIGVTFTAAAGGFCEGTWVPTADAANPRGAVQGGMFGPVLDAAMSMAINSALPRSDTCVSLEFKVSQPLAAIQGDNLHVSAKVVRMGGSAIFAEAAVSRADAEFVATASGTFLRRHK